MKSFGSQILGIPTRYYDVPFPSALNKFVLEPLKIGHQVSLVVFENVIMLGIENGLLVLILGTVLLGPSKSGSPKWTVTILILIPGPRSALCN